MVVAGEEVEGGTDLVGGEGAVVVGWVEPMPNASRLGTFATPVGPKPTINAKATLGMARTGRWKLRILSDRPLNVEP